MNIGEVMFKRGEEDEERWVKGAAGMTGKLRFPETNNSDGRSLYESIS